MSVRLCGAFLLKNKFDVYNQVCPEVEKNGKKESTITYNYVNDVNLAYTEVLQVNGKENKPLHTYIYGVQRIQDDKKGERTQYYNYDGKGSVIGKQVGNDLHLAFKVKYNDDGKPSRNMDNEFGYNGEAHDYHGTQYLRARYYDTNIGRFNQRDLYRGERNTPISQNRYTYVWNNALKYEDKSGNWPSLKGIIGGISGGINGLVNGAKAGWQEGGLLGAIAGGTSGAVSGAKSGYQAGVISESAGDAWKNGWTAGGVTGQQAGTIAGQTIQQGGSLYNAMTNGIVGGQGVVTQYEAARREAEEQARREEQRLTEEKQNIENQLRDAGINLSNLNLDGKTLKEQVEILLNIKKICEAFEMGTEHFDKTKAQQLVDIYIEESSATFWDKYGFELVAGGFYALGAIGIILVSGGTAIPGVMTSSGTYISGDTIASIGMLISGTTTIAGMTLGSVAEDAYRAGDITKEQYETLIFAAGSGTSMGITALIIGGTHYVFEKNNRHSDLNFSDQKKLDEHYQKHVVKQQEFGDITKEQYLKGAQELPLNSDYSGVRSNGDTLFYNSKTNEFAIVTPDKVIRTYFKPADGLEYYLREIRK